MPTATVHQPVGGVQRLFVVPAGPRNDPFARLVRQVAADPDNACNLDRFLWVLEEAPPEPCDACGTLFGPSFDYWGAPARGLPRRYCSRRCADHVAYRNHQQRLAGRRWGSAA